MTIAIHQPNFLPWIGFFYKILNSDKFVLLDDVQFTKNSFINRNKIKTPNGEQWLTIPVQISGKFGQSINEVKISNHQKSINKILRTIQMNYSKSDFFELYYPKLEKILQGNYEYLVEININLIKWIKAELEIDTELLFSSNIKGIQGNSTERLISICRKIKVDYYFSGFGGFNYQDTIMFNENNIQVIKTDFKHPIYSQLWGEFIPNLSIIDMLFNCGTESKKIIRKK